MLEFQGYKNIMHSTKKRLNIGTSKIWRRSEETDKSSVSYGAAVHISNDMIKCVFIQSIFVISNVDTFWFTKK